MSLCLNISNIDDMTTFNMSEKVKNIDKTPPKISAGFSDLERILKTWIVLSAVLAAKSC